MLKSDFQPMLVNSGVEIWGGVAPRPPWFLRLCVEL